MPCGGAGFDLQKQREALEQLRLEVEALDYDEDDGRVDDADADAGLFDVAGDGRAALRGPPARRRSPAPGSGGGSGAGRGAAAPHGEERRLEAAASALEARHASLARALEAAAVELRERAAARAAAKADWNQALGRGAAAEQREARRLAGARKRIAEGKHEEAQQDAATRLSRDKLQQRLRNLRMQIGHAERRHRTAEEEESIREMESRGRGRASESGGRSRSASVGERGTSRGVFMGRTAARREDEMAELRERREDLLEGELELQESERGLRRVARLSDREVLHWERRAEFQEEERILHSEQAQLRVSLEAVEREAEGERQEAHRLRSVQERVGTELTEQDSFMQEEQAEEAEALRSMERFLAQAKNVDALPQEERQANLAEYLEADVSIRHVELVRAQLAEIVADASARAQVLERAVSELHCDLDRRAAIILELVERQSNATGPWAGFEEDNPSARNSFDRDDSAIDAAALEQRALQEELRHQRGLFDLRGEQVQGLEQRLAGLLAREAPRVHALRAWIQAHEAVAWQRLEACREAAGREHQLRAEVEAMRADRCDRLAATEAGWRAHRLELVEAAKTARRGADFAATSAAVLHRRREGLLKNLDKLLKAENGLVARATNASQAVERDQRRLVDLTARQLRVVSAASARRRRGSEGGTARGSTGLESGFAFGACGKEAQSRAAQQALRDARTAVEATRARQVDALVSIQQEAVAVGSELRRVTAILALEDTEVAMETARAERAVVSALRKTRSVQRPASRGPPEPGRQLRSELESVTAQLRQLETGHEESHAEWRQSEGSASTEIETSEAALARERARQKVASAGVLKMYRTSHASFSEVEQRCTELRSELDAARDEAAEARGSFRTARGRNQRRAKLEAAAAPRELPNGRGAEAMEFSHLLWGSREQHAVAATSPRSQQEAPVALARALPSLAEVRARSEEEPELYAFYVQVLPILRGASIDAYRRPRQRFEARQLLLSSDLRRLELWPPIDACKGTATDAGLRRKGVAEAFVRVEALTRTHVPRATLAAVQEAIAASGRSPTNTGSDDTLQDRSPCNGTVHTDGAATCGPSIGAPAGQEGFPFDLVILGAEPWRLLAADINTFHVVTSAVGALLTHRASLPSFALALGLGAGGVSGRRGTTYESD